jgi:D-alanine-D-alanine ligase
MHSRVAIVYNKPVPSRYALRGEEKAVVSVLDSVEAAHKALVESGYDVVRVPLTLPLEPAREELKSLVVDLVFNLFEGFAGYPETEALVPEMAAGLGIPYTGCPAAILMLALDKAKTKAILEESGIATPRYQVLSPETLSTFNLNYPCIVKPCSEDASHGLSEESVVYEFTSLERQVKLISGFYSGGVLVEDFIDGQEFNATVLGNSECTVLPISEITYSLPLGMPRILTFAAKWEPGSLYFQGTKPICPAQIPESQREGIAEMALAAFRLLCSCGYARVDMRFDREGTLNVMEVNPNPDISPGTGAARQAEAAGMSYTEFIAKIVSLATEKSQQCQPRFAR